MFGRNPARQLGLSVATVLKARSRVCKRVRAEMQRLGDAE
jgi:hypothetical protein